MASPFIISWLPPTSMPRMNNNNHIRNVISLLIGFNGYFRVKTPIIIPVNIIRITVNIRLICGYLVNKDILHVNRVINH